jgi:uncharacterized alkaline shock family protein YloU
MSDSQDSNGITTIAPGVLHTIAQHATLNIPGTSRFQHYLNSGLKGFFSLRSRDGIFIQIIDDVVNIDLYVILQNDINVHDICRAIQRDVNRSISELVGMQVGRINIFIEDIDFSSTPEAPTQ